MAVKSYKYAGAAIVLASLTLANEASACHDQEGNARTTICFTSLHAGVATLFFAPTDIYYASKRQWLPPKWAWTQLFLGGIATIGGSVTAIGMAAADSPDAALDIGWSASIMALGGFYSSVATLSLQKYTPPVQQEEGDASTTSARPWLPHLSVLPSQDGFMMMLSL